MGRYIAILTKTQAKRYELGKDVRPLTTVRSRLYRTDEKYNLKVADRDETILPYPVDEYSPMSTTDTVEWISPDETMALIDIANASGSHGINRLGILNELKPEWIIYGIVGVVIIASIIGGLL